MEGQEWLPSEDRRRTLSANQAEPPPAAPGRPRQGLELPVSGSELNKSICLQTAQSVAFVTAS